MYRSIDQSAVGHRVFDWAERGAAHATVVRDDRDMRGSGITDSAGGNRAAQKHPLCGLIIIRGSKNTTRIIFPTT